MLRDHVESARNFLGLKRSIVGLLSMAVLVEMGEKMAKRFLPIYLIALGGGPIMIGLLNGMDNLLAALYAFPGGYVAQRHGAKRALLIFNLLAIAGFLVVAIIPSVWAVIVGAMLFISWSAISLPATMSLVADVLPKSKRTMGVSMHSLIRRIPMALGPLFGGWLIAIWGEREGVRLSFVIATVMALVAVLVQQRMISETGAAKSLEGTISPNPLKLIRSLRPELKRLLVSDVLIRFCEQIPFAFVIVWCMKTISNPVDSVEFGVLTTIEMATAVLCYIPVASFADKTEKKPFVVLTFAFFTIFPIILLFSQSFWPLVGAFVVRGLKEFGEPTRKALILDLAHANQAAITFGTYYLIRDCIVSLAAFAGAFLWMISPEANFLAAAGFGLIGTVYWALQKSPDVIPRRES